jgi:sterol desaturase/sphingolipid hydroxylase (fatty acid hydroxylase superfamily)
MASARGEAGMAWLQAVGGEGLFGIPAVWLPIIGFWLLLFLLAGAELARPLHRRAASAPGRLVANFGLGIINALILSALPLSAVLAADWAAARGLGLLHLVRMPTVPAFIVSLLAWSLAGYVLHVLAHHLRWLWRVHRVHHADTLFDLSTGLRHHPLEPLYTLVLFVALAVLLGLDPRAIAVYSILAGVFALWTHANIRLPARTDRVLRWLVMTPAAHQLHHSAARHETDSNYGDVLVLWDRLFGTWRAVPAEALTAMRLGLGGGFDDEAGQLLAQLRLPLAPPAPPRPRSEA